MNTRIVIQRKGFPRYWQAVGLTDRAFDSFDAARTAVLKLKAAKQRSVPAYEGELAAWASRDERISIVEAT